MSPIQTADSLLERASRSVASRWTRRSLFGQVGRGSVALALGTSVAELDPDKAAAYHENAGCNTVSSVTCNFLFGSNQCPGTSCTCGYWVIGGGVCAPQNTLWADCCGDCGQCRCVNQNGTVRPTCCNQREWAGGCHADLSPHIKCRVWNCTTLPGGSHT